MNTAPPITLAAQLREIADALEQGAPDGMPLVITGHFVTGHEYMVTRHIDGRADLKTRDLHLGSWTSWSKPFPLARAES